MQATRMSNMHTRRERYRAKLDDVITCLRLSTVRGSTGDRTYDVHQGCSRSRVGIVMGIGKVG